MNDQEQAAMRVAIAKDAIEQLKARRLHACTGVYLEIGGQFLEYLHVSNEAQIKEVIAGKTCNVCAMGALFVATVDMRNEITVGDITDGDDCEHEEMRNYLDDLFTRDQLCLIEMAFEDFDDPRYFDEDYVVVSDEDSEAASRWKPKIANDGDRLTGILENVVRNDGTFKPADLPSAIVA